MPKNKPLDIQAADQFCGAGGFTSGLKFAIEQIERESGQPIRLQLVAVNHWEVAIATHSANHPEVQHLCDDLERVDARQVFPGGKLRLLLSSPECTHFSNARGGGTVNPQSRATAKYIVRWCSQLDIEDVIIENVREFRTWGPLHRNHPNPKLNGTPIASRKGQFFKAFIRKLATLGYHVEHRLLIAADYGDPTSRKRLFIRARKSNKKIVWPQLAYSPTGKPNLAGQLPPYRTAREIIDWTDKGESIFLTHAQARDLQQRTGKRIKRPLEFNTLRRIFIGLQKIGLAFLLPNEGIYRGNQPRSVDNTLNTITSRGAGGLVESFLVKMYGTNDIASVDRPLPTQTGANHIALSDPFLVNIYGNSSAGSVDKPLPAQVSKQHTSLAQGFLVQLEHSTEASGHARRVQSVTEPMPTLTGRAAIAIAQPSFLLGVGGPEGHRKMISADKPLPAVTGTNSFGVVETDASFVLPQQTPGRPRPVGKPLPTIASAGAISLIQPDFILAMRGGDDGYVRGASVDAPVPTITTLPALSLIQTNFIIPTNHGQSDSRIHATDAPFPTVTSVDAWGLASLETALADRTITIPAPDEAAVFGPFAPYLVKVGDRYGLLALLSDGAFAIMDIRFRMLKPRELARAHSLDDYQFTGTRDEIVKQIGNSVPRRLAQALCYSALTH